MANDLQEWPTGAEGLADLILKENKKLWNALETAKNEGIDRKYYRLVKILLPNILERVEAINGMASEIIELADRTPRRGRKPKWLTATEETGKQAGRIKSAIKMAYDEAKKGRWIVVAHLVVESRKACQVIYTQMSIVPIADSDEVIIPEIFYQ